MKNIFIGNLDFNTSEETLRSMFELHGAVESVRLMTDRGTGQSRGFAFVEMADAEQADRAISALHGTIAEGRALTVREAHPRVSGGAARQRRGQRL